MRRLTKNEKRRKRRKKSQFSSAASTNINHQKINTLKLDESDRNVDYEVYELNPESTGLPSKLLENIFSGVIERFDSCLGKDIDESRIIGSYPVINKNRDDRSINYWVDHQVMDFENDLSQANRKAFRQSTRITIPELKNNTIRPDVVEAHDTNAHDPILLIHLKSSRNTVSVPKHWNAIRKYLMGKVGNENSSFILPSFIADTGITKIREAVIDTETKKSASQKAKERTRPKIGQIDIDYQVLYDAFFKYQNYKSVLLEHGDIYYEGKDGDGGTTGRKGFRPGTLSDKLRSALGLPSNTNPPPWLNNMQRYGPPPGYPSLKIPGLNAPIPLGCHFGHHSGGWGKPPVDEYGVALYGNVFSKINFNENEDKNNSRQDYLHQWGLMKSSQSAYTGEHNGVEDVEANIFVDNAIKDDSIDDKKSEGLSKEESSTDLSLKALEVEPVDLRKRKLKESEELRRNTKSKHDLNISTDKTFKF